MNRPPDLTGRGTPLKPPNRFDKVTVEEDWEHLEHDEDHLASLQKVPTVYLPDSSRSVISENDSPDLGFRYSLNPYRGCSHGCAYCYARPTHEYLGLSAGLDFETKVFVKERAPELFRDWLARDKYVPDVVVMSGVTDCYQPAERDFQITRRCLEVALAARQPIGIITKNALVTRDLDILSEMAKLNLVGVGISLTTLDAELARTMEPRTSTPAARLRAVTALTKAGVPAKVMTAPIVPGLNDHEIPALLKAASEAGAVAANYILLRLPYAVKPIFLDWLSRTQPLKQERVESRIKSTRDGKLSNAEFGKRMRGTGEIADQIARTFTIFARRYGLDRRTPPLDVTLFRPPKPASGQMRLF